MTRFLKKRYWEGKILRKIEFLLEKKILKRYIAETFLNAGSDVNLNPHYIAKSEIDLSKESFDIKTLAFYLPQFHPFPENDQWWGKGFTEWTNVTKAKPQFVGHYQPHLPGELGFYDLRLPVVLEEQFKLAKKYGIYGFCFHHYWFSGKRLMETPVNNILADQSIDIRFCLCWANGSFTRCWDGEVNNILMEQKYSPEDDIQFFESLVPAFNDSRYIRVKNKPLLVVYNAYRLPDIEGTISRWRDCALKSGFDGIYIVAAEAESKGFDFGKYDFDGVTEFPPHAGQKQRINKQYQIVNDDYSGSLFEYENMASTYVGKKGTGRVNFKAIVPSWDNEARRPGRGVTFVGSTPEKYKKWLEAISEITMNNKPEERILFINAWNEWAEGAHLEPCRYFGYGYLEATAQVLEKYIVSKGEF